MMRLKSVPKPAIELEAARPKIERRVLQGNTGEDLLPKRLVRGKRTEPLSPPSGGLTLESIIGLDERTRIVNTDQLPWRLICALEIDAPFGQFVGTAWFAGPRTLITAGHCVHHQQMGGWANRITISPGRNANERPIKPFVAGQFSTVDAWLKDENPDFDIAAIHLDNTVDPSREWFSVGSLADDELNDQMVNVSGYPGDKGGDQQWWARNRIRHVTARRIFYDVDTMGGQSGGPAFLVEDGGAPLVVGIHAYGVGGTPNSVPFPVNSAPRIIPEVVEQIEGWVKQDGTGT